MHVLLQCEERTRAKNVKHSRGARNISLTWAMMPYASLASKLGAHLERVCGVENSDAGQAVKGGVGEAAKGGAGGAEVRGAGVQEPEPLGSGVVGASPEAPGGAAAVSKRAAGTTSAGVGFKAPEGGGEGHSSRHKRTRRDSLMAIGRSQSVARLARLASALEGRPQPAESCGMEQSGVEESELGSEMR